MSSLGAKEGHGAPLAGIASLLADHRVRQVLDSLPMLVSYVDSDRRYRFVNTSYEEWFGLSRAEILGRRLDEVLGKEAYQVIEPYLERALQGKEVIYEAFVPYRHGGSRHVRGHYVPVREDSGGEVTGYFILVEDISARRRAQEQLEARVRQQEAVAALGRDVLAGMSAAALLDRAVDQVADTLQTDAAVLFEWLAGGDELELRSVRGLDRSVVPGHRVPVAASQAGYALAGSRAVLVEDLAAETRFPPPRHLVESGMISGVSVPIPGEPRPYGVLSCHSRRPRRFTQDDVHFMESVAHVVAGALRRESAERELKESEERFRVMADTAPVMIWVADAEMKAVYFNQPWLDFTGKALEAELGDGWSDGMHPDDREAAFKEYTESFAARRPVTLEYRLRRRDGQWRWLLDSSVPRTGAGGRFLGYIGSCIDITDRRTAEEELQKRLSELAVIYGVSEAAGRASHPSQVHQAAIDGLLRGMKADRASILLFDPDGVMRFKAWQGLSEGYRRQVEGHSPWDRDVVNPEPIVVPDVEAADLGPLKGIILGEGIRAMAFLPLTDGRRLLGKFMVYFDLPRGLSEQELLLGWIIGQHVAAAVQRHRAESDLKSLNETLERRVAERTATAQRRLVQLRALALDLTETEERERRRLAQSLHDDLQQLLVAAQMRIGGIAAGGAAGSAAAQGVRDLLQQALQASREVTVELSPPILFEAGLAQALEWLVRQMRSKYRLLVRYTAGAGTDVRSDGQRAFVFRAARELLFNVVKHAGTLDVAMSLDRKGEDAIQLTVEDRGRGFDLERSGAREGSSAGFGLFGLRERAEALGGSLEIESRPGRGTVVRLTAPLGPPEEAAARAPEAPRADETRAERPVQQADELKIRVLVADDHKIVREGLTALLSNQDDIEAVGQAADGEEAVSLAIRLRPHVVLMDVSMPKLSGVEATRRIVAQAPSIKVIALSMHESPEISDSMLGAGAVRYLTKDRAPDDLCDLIRMEGRAP
ncbi:MAG TPA: PAS domain S-box protein [Candidatus Polarisedimenticolia bacterium]|nr:PAS domain S-box protein [Candidatus Polarisedimenticolia bacterium]